MTRIGYLFLLIVFCVLAGKGWHAVKDGFNINRVIPLAVQKSAFNPQENGLEAIALPDADERVVPALQQTYSYLGRGHQCYAFGSTDGRYVLKLPRYDRYELSFFLRSFPFPFFSEYKEKIRTDLRFRFQFIHNSFAIAFNELKGDTGLVYLHLCPTEDLSGTLKIIDRIGNTYSLDPNKTPFILQEKKPIMMAIFVERLEQGDRKGAEEILDSFLELLARRSKKEIYNKDPSFLRNFGYEEGKGYQIDIGS